MKPTTFLTTVLAVSLSLFSAAAAPLPSDVSLNATSAFDLAERAGTPPPVPAALPLQPSLGKSQFLFRAVTNDELTLITSRYPVGHSPTGHKGEAGDFSSTGAIYAFSDITQADKWGQSFTTPKFDHYFMVKFQYTVSKTATRKAFASGTPDWVTFVSNNYAKRRQQGFDIVEGPISVKSAGSFIPSLDDNGQMLHQLAFVTPAGLGTLKVVSVSKIPVPAGAAKPRFCPGCTIQ
ncbi:hypothetical protein EVG20_g8657 [Dentipellis fragilis]|uniref:NADH:ubiquinone oxidoreductase intermediate-associated protein 30 domain-containing protein n=1 Tax=Dentipellis fragilis TaxID=205917 RepID=A0A4Y9Y3T3_9AGAM|nr:hypothetical protein EVG20_g8657 [Dentipellis fragilis]